MPRLPILSRDKFYAALPHNGGVRELPFNLVNTSLGAMIEPVSFALAGDKAAAVDVYDAAATRITEINADQFYSLFGTSGPTIFTTFAR